MPGRYSGNVRLELSLAGRDIESGDLTSAAARVSNVLISAPSLPQAHEILALLAAHPRGGRELFPMTSPLALATVIARAHVVAAEGDFGYALGLLGKAQAYAPETAWAEVAWVADPATAASVNPAAVTNLAVDLLEVLRGRDSDSLRAAMNPYLQLIRSTIAAHPDDANLLGAAAYFSRRFDAIEAAGYAARTDQLAPSHASAVAVGLIYRDLGRTGEALRAFECALSYKPADLEVHADICDLLMDADRLDEALTYAQRALAIDPAHICSQIATRAIQFRKTRQAVDFDAFKELVDHQPTGTHARRHGERVLQSTVIRTADRITTIQRPSRRALKQTRRFLRGRPE